MFERREVQSRGRGASTLGELPAHPTQNSPPSALLQPFLPPPPSPHPPLRIQSSMSFSLLTQRLLDPLSNMNPCDQCVSKPLKYIHLKYIYLNQIWLNFTKKGEVQFKNSLTIAKSCLAQNACLLQIHGLLYGHRPASSNLTSYLADLHSLHTPGITKFSWDHFPSKKFS